MRLLLVSGVALGVGGCESCDFSFGPIPLEIHLDPPVEATVTVCGEEGGDTHCMTLHQPPQPGDPEPYQVPDPPEEDTVYAAVDWDGYAVCRYPGLEIDVEAPGCAPAHVSVPKERPKGRSKLRVEVKLDCG